MAEDEIQKKSSIASKIVSYTLPVVIILGGVAIVIYFVYKYFTQPLDIAQQNYKYWITEIVSETKTWLEENEKQGIYGLTAGQQKILDEIKKPEAEFWRKQAEEEFATRRMTLDAINDAIHLLTWTAVIAGVGTAGAYAYAKFKGWRSKPESTKMIDSFSQIDLSLNCLAEELAGAGKLAQAQGLQTTITTMFTAYTLPRMQTTFAAYQTQIAMFTPGSIQYIALANMMNYLEYGITTQAITTIMMPFWLI